MKKYLFILPLFAALIAAGCTKAECNKSEGPEAELVLDASADSSLNYPPDFYVDVSPLARAEYYNRCIFPCASSPAEAEEMFDYAYYGQSYPVSYTAETDKYYMRVMDYYGSEMKAVIFKCAYAGWDFQEEKLRLNTLNAAAAKEFAELWFQVFRFYDYYDDIITSEITEDTDYFTSTIRHSGTLQGLPCFCAKIYVYKYIMKFQKSTGFIEIPSGNSVEISEYYPGTRRPCY